VKNFENRSITGKDMDQNEEVVFYWPTVYMISIVLQQLLSHSSCSRLPGCITELFRNMSKFNQR